MEPRSTLLGSERMGLVRFIGNLFFPFKRRFSRSPEQGENEDQWLGREGERLAQRHLRRNRYKILYRNFRAPHGGEVDLVCRDRTSDALVFVEVKTRRGLGYGSPAEAVTRDKQKLIARGALAWLRLLDNPDIVFRFDIVEVVVDESGPAFNIIQDAFKLPEPYIY
jgi:putative endonuclease